MKNLIFSEEVKSGSVYIFEMANGESNSYRILSETPSHYILSFSNGESFEVFEKAKSDLLGIFEVKDWWNCQQQN